MTGALKSYFKAVFFYKSIGMCIPENFFVRYDSFLITGLKKMGVKFYKILLFFFDFFASYKNYKL